MSYLLCYMGTSKYFTTIQSHNMISSFFRLGLGKTVQTIAALRADNRKYPSLLTLFIALISVMEKLAEDFNKIDEIL